MHRRVAAVLIAAGLLATTGFVVPSARAAASRGLDPLVASTSAPLLADCSRVTPIGREYARLHDLDICGTRDTPLDHPLPTEAVGGEECGSLTLAVTGRGAGLIAVAWRASSRTGPVLGVDLDISMSGRTADAVRHVSRSTASRTSRGDVVGYTGSGRAQVTVTGTVDTFTVTCTVTPATTRILVR